MGVYVFNMCCVEALACIVGLIGLWPIAFPFTDFCLSHERLFCVPAVLGCSVACFVWRFALGAFCCAGAGVRLRRRGFCRPVRGLHPRLHSCLGARMRSGPLPFSCPVMGQVTALLFWRVFPFCLQCVTCGFQGRLARCLDRPLAGAAGGCRVAKRKRSTFRNRGSHLKASRKWGRRRSGAV